MDSKSVAIIGAGPAGCMCAYYAQEKHQVTLFDFAKPLHTLLYTGGGRCNLAYAEYDFKELAKFYPRGEKFLYSIFSRFCTGDTIDFFAKIGVETYMQDDYRFFPTSNSAADVREKFLKSLDSCVFKKEKVMSISAPHPNPPPLVGRENSPKFLVETENNSYPFDEVVIAVGGHAGFSLANGLGHEIIAPKPALTGLVTKEGFKPIQGVSLKNIQATVSIRDVAMNSSSRHRWGGQGRKAVRPCDSEINSERRVSVKLSGDLLFTHEGISGPLAYTVSSICAREDYSYSNPLKISLNFIINNSLFPLSSSLFPSTDFQDLLNTNSKKDIKNLVSELVPRSLAEYLLQSCGVGLDEKCHQINAKKRDLILQALTEFEINVISTGKDGEVVTSGGVCLDEINPKTMESKLVEGLYFAGEVIDVDGFCGGFNLQNCWSTGFVAGTNI